MSENSYKMKWLDLFNKDYVNAEVTAAFIFKKDTNESILLYLAIELCGFEHLYFDGEPGYKMNIGRDTVYISITKISLEQAYDIFFEQMPKKFIEINGRIIKASGNRGGLLNPFAPALLYSEDSKKNNLTEVIPYRHNACRIWYSLDKSGTAFSTYDSRTFDKIFGFIKETIGIDLLYYKEYAGLAVLLCDNPLFRRLGCSLSKNEDKILFKAYVRKGKSMDGCKIILSDERNEGFGFWIEKHVDKNSFYVEIPYSPDVLRVMIINKRNQLIYNSARAFIKGISFSIDVKGATRKVNTGKEIFDIETFNSGIKRYLGKEPEEKTEIDLSESKFAELRKQGELFFFDGDAKSRDEARGLIRELIGKTRNVCYIIDPYLSGRDIVNFGLFLKNTNAQLRLVSSAHFLIMKCMDDVTITEKDYLIEVLNRLKKQDKSFNVFCKVLKGRQKSPLHDRMLVVDNDVYLLGSSLSEFGSRMTTVVKLPKAAKAKVEKIWDGDMFPVDELFSFEDGDTE